MAADTAAASGGGGGSSPSAQTAPSAKYSFFQMGTVRLSVSMAKRHASKAAARCGALTAMKTLVSPMSRRPRRWAMATRSMANFAWMSVGDFFQFRERHGFVGFVIEIERAAAVGIVANAAVEGDDGAVGIGANMADENGGGDRVAAELDEVVGWGGGHGVLLGGAQPPLTGGRNATSSPGWSGVVQAANSRLRETAIAVRCSAKAG